MKRSCVALISGGLDSALAARLMRDQGIDVYGLYLSMSWGCCQKDKALAVARELGIPLMVLSVGEAYLDVIRNPKYGYGVGMNPCVDCRIYMFRLARRYQEEVDAGFVVTGEVVGQRPMSQRKQKLSVIEAESGLEGLLLRPLSAKRLEPTLPEVEGIVERGSLFGFVGRGRGAQLDLARRLGIREFSAPAGGCLLTQKPFADRTRDLFDHERKPATKDMELLALGRHFRIGRHTKIILGRNELENMLLEGHSDERYTCVRPRFAGPAALIAGELGPEDRQRAFSLIVKHTKKDRLPEGDPEFWVNGCCVVAEHVPTETETLGSIVKF